MSEVRNTFVRSRMNKDLDDRLLTNGEYRDAVNVQVSRSEGEDVGALENVLGNKLLTKFGLASIPDVEIIGTYEDDNKQRAYFIATNYTDTSDDELSNVAPYGSACYILMYDIVNQSYSTLVEGSFLNFSKTQPVFGIDLIEDLLFWTDNRNQPRKINVETALADPTYYTTEDQISVAKYYPYCAPYLYDNITIGGISTVGAPTPGTNHQVAVPANIAPMRVGMIINAGPSGQNEVPLVVSAINYTTGRFQTLKPFNLSGTYDFYFPTSKHVVDEFLPPSILAEFVSFVNPTLTFTQPSGNPTPLIGPNMLLTNPDIPVQVKTTGVAAGAGPNYTVTLDTDITAYSLAAGDFINFADPNPEYISSWPGDKNYLRDKFVRFAYRFKFDDGEYSLISPFTQPAFIPKQDGYIVEGIDSTNPTAASFQAQQIGASTIVSFFENKVNNVTLRIPTPFVVNELEDKLKVIEIDILYKESDGLAIQLLETIPVTDSSITGNNTQIYEYEYQSRKPIRTLPERETIRVFDKVPIRAMTQSSVGNRIIYGNFLDKHTPPETLPYSVRVDPKYPITNTNSNKCYVSYPTHSVKQNRNYQIGIVLSDRYGRQSDVVLSDLTETQYSFGSVAWEGSTVYHPYKDLVDTNDNDGVPHRWMGDSIKILFRDLIPNDGGEGYPGLYKSGEYTVTVDGAVVTGDEIDLVSLDPNISVGDIVTGTTTGGDPFTVSIVAIDTGTPSITVSAEISVDDAEVLTVYGEENKLGWYSYKVVVKQTKQEYYNAYLPNITAGSSFFTSGPPIANPENINEASFTTLLADNINKIPSDLQEVQPEQTQFRTSDAILYPRVAGQPNSGGLGLFSVQYYLGQDFITAETIGKLGDLKPSGLEGDGTVANPYAAVGIFKPESNPPLARFSTFNNQIGTAPTSVSYFNTLAVLEIDPLESNIEIFYETSTCGLISELNEEISNGGSSTPIDPEDPPDTEEAVEE